MEVKRDNFFRNNCIKKKKKKKIRSQTVFLQRPVSQHCTIFFLYPRARETFRLLKSKFGNASPGVTRLETNLFSRVQIVVQKKIT